LIRSILCLQQTGEIDNLIVSWAKFLVVLCAGSTLLLVQSKALDEVPYKLCGAIAKLASINLLKFSFLLLVRLNLGFTTEENLLLCSSYLPLGVPNWVPNMHYQAFFWRYCRGERIFLQGESLMLNLLLCFCFALFYFCLHHFIKKYKKKIVPLIVCILLLLPLFHYVVP
jgi:hypothetical protein